MPEDLPPIPPEIVEHYRRGQEASRLRTGKSQIELARTQELLSRHLDPVPLHLEQARAASAAQPGRPVASVRLGDARRLVEPDGSAHAVLLLGPLYHLTERGDRLSALREARRVLRPAGLVFAAGVGRFASLFDGLFHDLYGDPDYRAIVERDLRDGQHRNPTPRDYFTTAFFHRPDELEAEVRDAGFAIEALVGLEGPGGLLPDFARRWADPDQRRYLLWAAGAVEREPSLLGLSDHLLAVARRP